MSDESRLRAKMSGEMNCPNCNGQCWRDEVDIGVGVQCGPWRCEMCSWYEGWEGDIDHRSVNDDVVQDGPAS